MLYSATMPADISKMANFALNQPFNTVDTVGKDTDTHARVPQFCVVHPLRDTYEELLAVVQEGMQVGRLVVRVRRVRRMSRVTFECMPGCQLFVAWSAALSE